MELKSLKGYSFADGMITEIKINYENISVEFTQWNDNKITLLFSNCRRLIDYNCISSDIEELKITEESELINIVKQEIIDDGGSEDEIKNMQHFMFIGSWNDRVLLEVIADQVNIIQNLT